MTTTEQVAPRPVPEKSMDKRRALGRGLDSLLPAGPRVVAGTAVASAPATAPVAPAENQGHTPAEPRAGAPQQSPGQEVRQIPLEQIEVNPYQTRRVFDETALQELADSIRSNGVLQPVVVRPSGNGFALILGERRCRAAKLAGKASIPAIVQRVSDEQAAEMTIVENLQRQDLNCLEQAQAFARLSRDFGLTQEQIGQRVGVSRESVANYMRLLKLPDSVQQYLASGELGFSEARVLLQLTEPHSIPHVAKEAIDKKLSVAQLIELVDRHNLPREAFRGPRPVAEVDPNVRAAQTEIERALGCRVQISDRKGKGRIVIEYTSLEDFDRVVEMLGRKK